MNTVPTAPLASLAPWMAAGFVLACAGTWAVRRYALASGLLDRPNERSSHTKPTPRGGGVAIVAAFLLLVGMAGGTDALARAVILGTGLLVATLGFLDDRSGLPARVRFAGHAVCGIVVLWWLGGLPKVPILGFDVNLGWPGLAVAVAYVVWMINLYNFMDGIDGIASLQAISVAAGGALVWWLAGDAGSAGPGIALLLAACVAGFLVWNFPPAKIFMGDAGSGFLGLAIALLSLWCGHATPALFWSWFVLTGCFMVDATTTLVRRVRRGERFYEAHRSHAYQYASRVHGSHRTVTLAVVAINLLWLLPIALAIAWRRLDGVLGVVIAYTPLVGLAFRYKAGDRAAQAG